MSNDLFVVSPGMHTFFRGVAAFIIAPLLLWKGLQYQDFIVFGIGAITLIVDSFTFFKSIVAIRRKG
ncbi:MAG: hypothetical protein BWK76_01055 [Desulfobulbaceae bacterium A2]|nr:MAG: hypothetical protein BWK76_01055 [Desulfobulbaceae bacterium A2]